MPHKQARFLFRFEHWVRHHYHAMGCCSGFLWLAADGIDDELTRSGDSALYTLMIISLLNS